jgi:hypothetical protein|nr:MAG: hypothetical protein KatS3mg041_2102 [Bacteroidota bacterium]
MALEAVRWIEAEEALLLDALLRASVQRVPFVEEPFVRASEAVFGVRFRWLGYWKGQELKVAVPVFEAHRVLLGRLTRIPPLAAYVPFLLGSELSEALYQKACDRLAAFLEDRYGLCHFLLHPTQRDVRPFQWRRWSVEPRYTYWIPLEEGAPEVRWSESTRRAWRRYAGWYTFSPHDPEAWEDMVLLHRLSYRRHGRLPPLSESAHRELAWRLGGGAQHGVLQIASLRDREGQVVATIGWIGSAATAYYWMPGSRREAPQAMTVLIGYWLEYLLREGWQRVDFVGASTPGPAEFKRRFGGELVGYYRIWRYRRPWWALLDRIRQRGRRR